VFWTLYLTASFPQTEGEYSGRAASGNVSVMVLSLRSETDRVRLLEDSTPLQLTPQFAKLESLGDENQVHS